MSVIRRGLDSRNQYPQFAQTANPLNVLYGSTSVWSSAGERVDEISALGITAVLSCVNLLADTVASMDLRQYDGDEKRGFEQDREVPLSPVIADPDPEESDQFQLIHQMMVSMGLHGSSITHVERDSRFRPVGLTPLHPYQCQILPAKNSTGREFIHMGKVLPREDVLFSMWFASPQALTLADGVVGQIKVVAYVAQSAGTDAGRLTPATRVNYSYINFNSLNHTIILMYFTQGWAVIGGNGAVVV